MTHGAGIADYYAERAADYELIYERPERQADLGRLRGHVEAFGRDRHVLEVACGTGYWTRLLATTARTVVATDVGDVVLGLARARGLPGHVAIQRADAFALAEVAGDFDAAFAGFWWSHVPREALSRFLDGLHARLGAGASVLFLDNRYVTGSSTPIHRTDAEGNTYQRRVVRSGSTYEVLKNFPSPGEVRAALADRGAAHIEIVELEHYWLARYDVAAAEARGISPRAPTRPGTSPPDPPRRPRSRP